MSRLKKLGRLVPGPVRRVLLPPLRRMLCPQLVPGGLPAAGKPGTANLWWDELERAANTRIFPPLSAEAKQACKAVREGYRPLLGRFEVKADDFFWGSIKAEEAEALYQLVRERKPQVVYQVGTFVGYSALIIAHALRANGGGTLVAVDPEIPHRTFINPVDVAREAAKEQGLADYVEFIRGWHSGPSGDYLGLGLKQRIPTVGLEVLQGLGPQGVDLAFIDGDHSTGCTLTDFLLLKDYLNDKGVVVFHDVLSWPSVAQALHILWTDIYYFVRGTPAYFGLDLRRGQDGLAALQRIRRETFPTLRVEVCSSSGAPLPGALVRVPSVNLSARAGTDGSVYAMAEVQPGAAVQISCPGFQDYEGNLQRGTTGDYAEVTLELHEKETVPPVVE